MMGWDYFADEDGCVEIEVRRWYNQQPPNGKGPLEVTVVASGFEPNEPVCVEVLADCNE